MKKIIENISKVFLLVAVLFLSRLAADATTYSNYAQTGDRVVVTFATTSPTVGDAILKCAAKGTGGLVGVAMNGAASATENIVMLIEGVFSLPVTASSTVGNVAVGDYIYGSVGGAGVCTTVLSNINTGLQFGQALEAITASTTDGVLNTIKVRINQPGHL